MPSPPAKPLPVVTAGGIKAFLGGGQRRAGFKEALEAHVTIKAPEDRELYEQFVAAVGLAKAELDAAPESQELWIPENGMICQLQSFLAEQAQSQAATEAAVAVAPERLVLSAESLEAQFDDRDIGGWALSFFGWWRRLAKADFREQPIAEHLPIPIPDDTSLALFADWGVGPIYGARAIRETIDEPRRIKDPLYASIHLGDIYYAGTEKEVEQNLLANFPSLRSDVRRLALNGNHEMYGGARGYYQALDVFGQPQSYFALQNRHFTIIALDTAYDDFGLAGQQLEWVKRILNQAGASRKIIFLSHHQPFSAFEPSDSAKLASILSPILESGRILAWYWGHEHRCVVYDRHAKWGTLGRCIGHGGYPYFRVDDKLSVRFDPGGKRDILMPPVHHLDNSLWYSFPNNAQSPSGIILGDDNRYLREEHARYGAQGFVVLKLKDAQAQEEFLRPDGTPILIQGLTP